MRVSVLLPQFFLPPSAIKLGRFVTNIDEPHRDYLDPIPGESLSVIEKVETQYDSADSLGGPTRTNASIHINTEQVKTYYLDNNGQWFRDTVKSEDVRKWIERTIDEGEDIYVVIGYHTVLDARIAEQSRGQKLLDGNLAVPVSSEQIIAVQYRKVRFRFLSSKSVDNATLAKEARWERHDRPRYLQSDMEDMVEVALDDDLSLGGDRDKCIAGSEEIVFSNVGID
ncbi:hypothetical protein N7474_010705 [Penicillium riverlandense]|uniref:uncharacterized protein n=1 Tax=Penicillium riverlandense TaxID=1903569 RepID=UPI002546FDCA|nr:uncharacterized protein N7474_010705 [Penicillium riverlandense]KAJ5804818.1 hypothetical protein N7474_010705 [Penicillium riverlandense]